MRVLALGATGAIGTQLIKEIVARGHEIHVTSRRDRASSGSVHYIRGNARDDVFLHQMLQSHWDVIVDFMVYDTATFGRRIDRLLGACSQYLFFSSGRVFADSSSPLIENSPRLLDKPPADPAFTASDEYALAKARQEDMLRNSGRAGWTIVRPYITFGEGRLQLGTLEKESWLYRAIKGRSIVFCRPMLDRWTTMTEGSDVARMVAALVGNPAAMGQDFNLTGDQSVTWGQVLELYLDELQLHLGVRPNVVLQNIPEFCRAAASVPQIIYDRLYDRRFNAAKIGAHIKIDTLTDPMPALRQRLRTQLADGAFLALQGRGEALRDKVAGEYTDLRNFTGTKSRLDYALHRYLPQTLLALVRPNVILH